MGAGISKNISLADATKTGAYYYAIVSLYGLLIFFIILFIASSGYAINWGVNYTKCSGTIINEPECSEEIIRDSEGRSSITYFCKNIQINPDNSCSDINSINHMSNSSKLRKNQSVDFTIDKNTNEVYTNDYSLTISLVILGISLFICLLIVLFIFLVKKYPEMAIWMAMGSVASQIG